METEYEIINKSVKTWKVFVRQFFICSVSSVFAVMYGLGMGAPTVIIPQLRNEANSTDIVSEEMASWTSSVINFGGTAWVPILAIMAHYLGRKKTIFFADISAFLAFVFLYASKNITHVLISEALLGITAASSVTVSIMIVTEYTSPRYRGMLVTFKAASLYWGILISNTIGTFFKWRTIALCGITCAVYNFIVIFIIPESPVWLAKNRKYDKCAKSHRWVKGVCNDANKELTKLMNDNKTNEKEPNPRRHNNNWCYRYFEILRQPEMYKPFWHCVLLTLLYDWSGKILCTVYALDIIKKITNNDQIAYYGMLTLDGFSVLSMYLASILVKVWKRRTLMISATSVCVVLLYSISLYLYLAKLSIIQENSYITMSMLAIYSICVCCGPIIISDVVYGELIPVKNRSTSFTTIAVGTKIVEAVFLKIAPYIFKAFDIHGTFLVFATCSLICMVFIYKVIPETKDKTLDEISQYYRTSNNGVCKELIGFKTDVINDDDINTLTK